MTMERISWNVWLGRVWAYLVIRKNRYSSQLIVNYESKKNIKINKV